MALPSAASIAGGFTLGSAVDGSAGARGYLDQLTSYNAVLYQSFLNNFTSTETLFNRVAHPVERRKVELTATPVSGPEGLELRWNRGWEGDPAANAGKYTLEKRLVGVTNWSILRTNVFADSWRDTNAEPGKYYEYRVVRSPEELSPTITASLRGAAMESRGTAILLIDQTLATDLASQIDTFKLDLVADGWKVVSTLAHRHTNFSSAGVPDANYLANLQSNKGFIRTQWQANPNGTNVVILLGHVTVPYSGNTAEDGHTENSGSWSADLWYGDMDNDTNWTDSITGGAGFQQNRPLDGKWDNDFLPGNGRLEIPVGRIDFYNLPSFEGKPLANYTNSVELVERELLKNYLSKSSLYRQGRLGAFLKSSTAFSYDLRFISVFESQSRVSNWLMGQFTPASETTTDLFVKTNPVRLVGFHGGNGSFSSVAGANGVERNTLGISEQAIKPTAAFLFLRGSYFGNWNYITNEPFLRACLTPSDCGLAAFWVGPGAPPNGYGASGPWITSSLGVGSSLSRALTDTVNGPVRQSSRSVFILGDPTLRALNTVSVTNLVCAKSGSMVTLGWSWSATPGASYRVYRATSSLSDAWLSLTPTGLTTTNYVDGPLTNGSYHYLIKALGVEVSPVGSFTNVSQGVRTSITLP